MTDSGTRPAVVAHQRLPAPPGCLPCPFCGATDLAAFHTHLGYWILCRTPGCIAVGPQTTTFGAARQAWNTRHSPVRSEELGT